MVAVDTAEEHSLLAGTYMAGTGMIAMEGMADADEKGLMVVVRESP
jgi:hypothetical protein